jgi:hypothetical protein
MTRAEAGSLRVGNRLLNRNGNEARVIYKTFDRVQITWKDNPAKSEFLRFESLEHFKLISNFTKPEAIQKWLAKS